MTELASSHEQESSAAGALRKNQASCMGDAKPRPPPASALHVCIDELIKQWCLAVASGSALTASWL